MSEAAFLRQLDAEPADDVLRLVYADWLDEHERDDPRGAFLRAAVAARGAGSDTERAEHRQRVLELRPAVPTAWVARVFPDLAADDVREAVFREACQHGSPKNFFLFVERDDPSWYLLGRLVPDYPNLRPGSERRNKDEDHFDGTWCAFRSVQWYDREHCDVEFDTEDAPQMGSGSRYRVELREGLWTITDVQGTWIS